MSTSRWIVAIALALAGATAVRADGPPNQGKAKPRRPAAELRDTFFVDLGDHWVGLAVSPASDALQAQLKLQDDEGLVVENVVPDGPAAKAGIQPFDVLVKAGDTRLKDIRDFLAEINKVKDGKLKIELIRTAKPQTITVTPAARPEGMGAMQFPAPPGADREKIEAWLREMMPQMSEGRPLQFHFVHPGQILPPGASLPQGAVAAMKGTFRAEMVLPDGYKIEIVRNDGNPAKVLVTRGKEKWEATEGDLSKLPEKVRPEVAKFLGANNPSGFHVWASPSNPAAKVEIRTAPIHGGHPWGPESRIEKRLDEMKGALDKLRKEVDELRKATPQKK